jgi:PleD family two-component response regulator
MNARRINTIMLVDDDPDDCFLFRKALADVNPGISLQFVSDCDDLVPSLDAGAPQIVFMDINMPKKNGFDCVTEIRGLSRHAHLPVVMYSCSDQSTQVDRAFGSGVHLYLRKPSSYDALVASLRQILSLDWSQPDSIADSYLVEGKFYPYQVG